MARYILSLSGRKDLTVKQPLRGSQALSGDKGAYYLHASYTDKGAKGAKPLTATQTLVLRHPRVQAEDCDLIKGGLTYDVKAGQVPGIDQDLSIVVGIKDSYIAYKGLDLSGIALVEAQVGLVTNVTGGGSVEIRLDRPDGELIGSIDASQKMIEAGFGLKSSALKPVSGTHDLYFVFTGKDTQKPVCVLDWIWFKKGSGI
ncbi:MAG: carbohydrate-binding protein [Bacteroidetes bacterium]|nr:MAG: carbohydrate-binding protein [Bacteroidota bacterium]